MGAKAVKGQERHGCRQGYFNRATPVFGMLKREGKVYTQIAKNCSVSALMPIIEAHSDLEDSVIFSDTWRAYDGLVDYGAKAHYRVKTIEALWQK